MVSPFFFANNKYGFDELFSCIQPYIENKHICGLESTGHYGDNLTLFLLEHNCTVGIINPLSTDSARKQRIRKTKNDKKDTYIICDVLATNNYSIINFDKLKSQSAKELTRYRSTLVEDQSRLKVMLQKEIDIVFPEYNSLFKSKYSKVYMQILKKYPSAKAIYGARMSSLSKCFMVKNCGRTIDLTPELLKEKARDSVGNSNSSTNIKIIHLISRIEELTQLILEVDKKIEEYASAQDSPIYSIPGIGLYAGTAILAEISSIDLFDDASKLCAYSGLDPSVYQSGNYTASHSSISKRGSPYLRKVLYQVALPLCRHSPIFHNYYTKKRNEGKSHRCAQGHVIRKLIRIIFKLLSENILYDDKVLI